MFGIETEKVLLDECKIVSKVVGSEKDLLCDIVNASGDVRRVLHRRISEKQHLEGIGDVFDMNDWESDANGDGRLYPTQYRIVYQEARLPWLLIDETGWNGFEITGVSLVAAFASRHDAKIFRSMLLDS